MASKAYKLRLDNVADVPFNEDDLNVHGTEYEQGRQHDSKKQRFVDRTRLLAHVKVKVERSQKGRTAVLFIIFTTIYMSAIVLQRNCRDTQGLVAGMGKYLTSATFRDPGTFELKTFHDLANMDDVWMWHYYVLAPKIYTSHYYNGIKQEGKDRGSILTFNRLTTGFRMVQRRALNGTGTFCIARPKYQDFTKNCYGRTFIDSRLGDVEKLPFYSFDLRNKYEYKEEKAQGALDANVGYFEEFGIDRDSPLETARTRLRLLQNDMWINPGTAWLRTDFATYNPNLGLFCFVKFTFEFLPTGEMRSTYVANTMKGKLYQTPGDMTILALEGLAVLFWIIFVVRMWSHFVLEWRTKHRVLAYFDDFDHSLEFVQNFMFVAIVAMRFLIVTYPIRDTFAITEEDITVSAVECTGKLACSGNWWEPRAGFEPVKVAKRQMFHDSLGFLEDQYFNLNGVNAVFCLVRILSYLRINPNISQLTDTFMRCRSNMTQFAIVLFVLVLMFDIMAVFMFGAKLPEFNNIAIGFITTARFMLGSGDILALMEADKIAAPIFYYPFTFIMVFVVLNMTIAIIMDGYMDIQMEKKENLQWREDSEFVWLFASHPDRPGWKEPIHSKSVYSQIGEGTIRFVGILFVWALPARLRTKKLLTGEEFDRFEMPNLRITLRLLSALDDDENLKRFISWEDYYRLIKSGSTGITMNENVARWIVNRHNAWQKTPLDGQTKDNDDSQRIQEAEDQIIARLDRLRLRAASVVSEHQKINRKVDHVLRAISVPEDKIKSLIKKSTQLY